MPGKKTGNSNKRVIIVGGGPSGAAAAKAMADRGYNNVALYEAYPHPKSLSKTSSRAYVISVSQRGVQGILDSTGINLVEQSREGKGGVVSNVMVRHTYNSRKKKTFTSIQVRGSSSVSIARKALATLLLDAAEESGVRVHFHHRLVEINFDNRIAKFEVYDDHINDDEEEKNTSKMVEVEYDLLIGADGSNSKVRNLMVEDKNTLGDFKARIEKDSMEYQVVVIPKNPFVDSFPEGATHVWNNKELNAMSLGFAARNANTGKNDAIIVPIVFPEGQLESFRNTPDGYREPLMKLLPDLFEGEDGEKLLLQFEEQMRKNQIANGGLCVWSSSLGHAHTDAKGQTGGVILLGDSGHGMWPSLGQGANCALESVAVFVRCLDELISESEQKNKIDTTWEKDLVQRFHDARFKDAVSAVDLTYGGIGSRQTRGRQNAPLSFKLQMISMVILHKLTFGIIPMPAILRVMIGTPDLSYSSAKRFNFYYEKYICLGALFLFAVTIKVGMSASSNSSEDTPGI